MRTGTPADLAAAGVMETAFGGEAEFDPVTYTFVSRRRLLEQERIQGDT